MIYFIIFYSQLFHFIKGNNVCYSSYFINDKTPIISGFDQLYEQSKFETCFPQFNTTQAFDIILENFSFNKSIEYDFNFFHEYSNSLTLRNTNLTELIDINLLKLKTLIIEAKLLQLDKSQLLPSTLETINLSKNQIYQIHSGFFRQFPHLKKLILSHNKLVKISSLIFKSNYIDLIDLSNNYLKYILSITFENTNSSNNLTLDLENNYLFTIPLIFGDLKSIKHIVIGYQSAMLFKFPYFNTTLTIDKLYVHFDPFFKRRQPLNLLCNLKSKNLYINKILLSPNARLYDVQDIQVQVDNTVLTVKFYYFWEILDYYEALVFFRNIVNQLRPYWENYFEWSVGYMRHFECPSSNVILVNKEDDENLGLSNSFEINFDYDDVKTKRGNKSDLAQFNTKSFFNMRRILLLLGLDENFYIPTKISMLIASICASLLSIVLFGWLFNWLCIKNNDLFNS
ncbi:unnamed protein product [Brachionus calyciflorus]|uniref:Uncharacterized protein n=1 Tax=Brachionus calyciflorus TaxID=104777 RepID=A0A814AGY6_9BILA|nr:unnamed protein product [Brachionus calyciflorus]